MNSQVYTIPEIQDILGVSRTKAYEYIKKFTKTRSLSVS